MADSLQDDPAERQPRSSAAAPAAGTLPDRHWLMIWRIDLATGIYGLGWQLVLFDYAKPLGGRELAQHAVRLALLASVVLAVFIAPRAWLRIRVGAITLIRLSLQLLGVGKLTGPPAVLQHTAVPGFKGLLRDCMRLLLGTRILHVATVGAALQQPVLSTVLQQAAVLAIGSDVDGYCRAPLLTDGLMQARLARLESWLSTLLPGPLGLPLARLADAQVPAGSSPYATCVSVLLFSKVMFVVLLPALLVAGRATPSPPAEEQREPQERHGIMAIVCRTARKAGAAWVAADAQLAALCTGEELDAPHQLLLVHGVLSIAWALSRAAGFECAGQASA